MPQSRKSKLTLSHNPYAENAWTWQRIIMFGLIIGLIISGTIIFVLPLLNMTRNNRSDKSSPLLSSDNPPPFQPAETCSGTITASPWGDNMNNIEISTFGSAAGHPFGMEEKCFDFAQDGIRTNPDPACCGNYKHYVRFKHDREMHQIYSLANATISKITPEYGGSQLELIPTSSPHIRFRIFHVDLKEGIKEGDLLISNQIIGTANTQSWSDVAVEYFGPNREHGFISMFECMDERTLRTFGFKSIEEARENMTFKGTLPNCTNAHQSIRKEDSPEDFVSCCEKITTKPKSLWSYASSFFSSSPKLYDEEETQEDYKEHKGLKNQSR